MTETDPRIGDPCIERWLTDRGWIFGGVDETWLDSAGGINWSFLDAIKIQRARDEKERRDAWVRFAAGFAAHGHSQTHTEDDSGNMVVPGECCLALEGAAEECVGDLMCAFDHEFGFLCRDPRQNSNDYCISLVAHDGDHQCGNAKWPRKARTEP